MHFWNLTRILLKCLADIVSYLFSYRYMPKVAIKFGNLVFLALSLLPFYARHLVVANVWNTYCEGDVVLLFEVPLFMWRCLNVEETRVAFSWCWNSVASPQEPVTNKNLFLSQLWLVSPTKEVWIIRRCKWIFVTYQLSIFYFYGKL